MCHARTFRACIRPNLLGSRRGCLCAIGTGPTQVGWDNLRRGSKANQRARVVYRVGKAYCFKSELSIILEQLPEVGKKVKHKPWQRMVFRLFWWHPRFFVLVSDTSQIPKYTYTRGALVAPGVWICADADLAFPDLLCISQRKATKRGCMGSFLAMFVMWSISGEPPLVVF